MKSKNKESSYEYQRIRQANHNYLKQYLPVRTKKINLEHNKTDERDYYITRKIKLDIKMHKVILIFNKEKSGRSNVTKF